MTNKTSKFLNLLITATQRNLTWRAYRKNNIQYYTTTAKQKKITLQHTWITDDIKLKIFIQDDELSPKWSQIYDLYNTILEQMEKELHHPQYRHIGKKIVEI